MNSIYRLFLTGIALALLFLCLLFAGGPSLVHAEERLYSDEIPLHPTNWDEQLSIPLFDPAIGVLTKIEFVLVGQVSGVARLENLAAAPASITAESFAEIRLERPDGTFITLANPFATKERQLAAFDNTIDYAGPSGTVIEDIVGIDISERVVYTKAADLAYFTGVGAIDLGIKTTGSSQAGGGANVALSFRTSAGAAVTVTYTIEQPAIDLEKSTNGEDADQLPGPVLYPGDVVTWTYVVTNLGDVPLIDLALVDDREGDIIANCPQNQLAIGETMTCRVLGIAQQGQYTNTATVTGNVPSGLPGEPRRVTDTDPSHYFAFGNPAIDLEKLTNREDADTTPGPLVAAGAIVTWTYLVRNVGGIDLEGLTLIDDREGNVTANCPQTTLAVGDGMVCTVTGIAQAGQYSNTAVVTGTTPADSVRPNVSVTDTDPSHYFAVGEPAIDLEKLTNGEDADTLPGPLVASGDIVTWTYLVRNVGGIDLEGLTLIDDREGNVTVNCPQTTLAVGERMICTVTGIARLGQYTNTAVVTGTTPADSVQPNVPVTDADPSHYFGTQIAVCPVDGRGVALLPTVRYLGEGAGEYTLAGVEAQFVIKKFSPFRFITQHDSPYHSTHIVGAPERVWACSGECTFTRGLNEVIDLGALPSGVILHLLIIDDDDDQRVNTIFADDKIDLPLLQIKEQTLTEYQQVPLPNAAVWHLNAVDSIGTYFCVAP